jgi:exopolysaccharide production protein ExoZ
MSSPNSMGGAKLSPTLFNLQALRAFACVAVALDHIAIPIPLINESQDGLFGHGACGVDVFFVISGFVMVLTTRHGGISPFEFAYHRLTRIIPLYYLTTLAIFSGFLIFPQLFPNSDKSVTHLVASLLFLPSDSSPTNSVGWTLNYEMFFYLLFMVGLALTSSIWRVAFPLISIAILVIIGRTLRPEGASFTFLTSPMMLEFCFGIGIALVTRRLPSIHPAFHLTAALAAVVLMFSVPYPLQNHVDYFRLIVWGVPAVLLVLSALEMERSGWSIRWRPIILIGESSYAIYLTHYSIAQAYKKFPVALEGNAILSIVMALAALFIIIISGIVCYKVFDKPTIQTLRRTRWRSGLSVPEAEKRL